MLEIHDLYVRFGHQQILKGINLEIHPGETLAVVGESGAGKSTLGLTVAGLAGRSDTGAGRSHRGGEAQGRIRLNGQELLQMSEEDLRHFRLNCLGYVFQNVVNALNPVLTVLDQVAEPALERGLENRRQALDRAVFMLERTGLTLAKAQKYPHQLSGGENQRALLAMALMNEPELLILDEPTASLDPLLRREMTELLRRAAQSCAVLLITHDLSVASALADRTAVLYNGMIMEEGPSAKVLQTPQHPYMRALLRSYPHMNSTKDMQSIKQSFQEPETGCPFQPRCTQALETCTGEVPPLVTLRVGAGEENPYVSKVACHRGGIVPYLVLHKLCKHYDKSFALQEMNFIIFEGETVALVGRSGSGKSTVAKLIMGLEAPDGGKVLLEEQEERFPRRGDFFRKIQMVFQNPYDAVNSRMTVGEAVTEPLVIQHVGNDRERLDKARRVLLEVGLPHTEEFLQSSPATLSGGELQRLAIARSLVLDPKLLIADEPTSALDAIVQARILKLLMGLQEERGLGMLFITHDLALARKVADRIIVMNEGQIVEQGLAWEITHRPRHPYTRQLMEAAAEI